MCSCYYFVISYSGASAVSAATGAPPMTSAAAAAAQQEMTLGSPTGEGVENGHRFYFMIGSVDSFERKLDEAQKELGVNSSAYVPVKFSHEVRWYLFLSSYTNTCVWVYTPGGFILYAECFFLRSFH